MGLNVYYRTLNGIDAPGLGRLGFPVFQLASGRKERPVHGVGNWVAAGMNLVGGM